MFSCSRDLKETAYKGLMHHILEYGSSLWDPHSVNPKEELEKVKKRAARFVTRSYSTETGSMPDILGELHVYLQERGRIIYSYYFTKV